MTMTYVEKQELKLEVFKGFELLLGTVGKLEALAEELESGKKNETTAGLLGGVYLIGLKGVQDKLEELLNQAYSLNDPAFIQEMKDGMQDVAKGKEHLLLVALLLAEGGL